MTALQIIKQYQKLKPQEKIGPYNEKTGRYQVLDANSNKPVRTRTLHEIETYVDIKSKTTHSVDTKGRPGTVDASVCPKNKKLFSVYEDKKNGEPYVVVSTKIKKSEKNILDKIAKNHNTTIFKMLKSYVKDVLKGERISNVY
jgi:hypothetical protein